MGLKLRQLAKPLKEARKDLKVNKAVLFVEDLFGRKMKNQDTKILLVTEKNRSACIYALKYDPEFFVKNRIKLVFALFMAPKMFSLFNKERAKDYFPKKSRMSFSRFKGLVKESIMKTPSKNIMEILGEGKPNWHERMFGSAYRTAGIQLPIENILVVRDDSISELVHELIHAEDVGMDPENPIKRVILEGRACYGMDIYERIESGADLDTLQILMDARRRSLFGNDGIIRRNFLPLWERLEKVNVRKTRTAMNDFLDEIRKMSWERQKYYVPFTIAIAELAHILNDPYAGFRITTEKQPRKMEDIKNIKEFYKKEIEDYQKRN